MRQQMRRAPGRDGGVHEISPTGLPREVEHRGARTRAEHQRGRAWGIVVHCVARLIISSSMVTLPDRAERKRVSSLAAAESMLKAEMMLNVYQ